MTEHLQAKHLNGTSSQHTASQLGGAPLGISSMEENLCDMKHHISTTGQGLSRHMVQ